MRTGKTHRLKTCATRRGSEGLPVPGSRRCSGTDPPQADWSAQPWMAERSQHRASEGQDAGSRAAPGDRKPEPTPGRRRRRDSRVAVASVRRRAWAAPSLIHARASRVSRRIAAPRSAGFQPGDACRRLKTCATFPEALRPTGRRRTCRLRRAARPEKIRRAGRRAARWRGLRHIASPRRGADQGRVK